MKNKKGYSRLYFEGKGNMLKSKRSLEMAFSTIVVTVLAVILLILVIVALTGGFKTFREKVGAYFSESNVDLVAESCNLLAEQNSGYEYCCTNKTIRLSSKQKLEMSCSLASNQSWGGKISKLNCDGVC